MGICAYSSAENTGSSALYFCTMLLIAAIAATKEICAKKLLAPSTIQRPAMRGAGRKSAFAGLSSFARQR